MTHQGISHFIAKSASLLAGLAAIVVLLGWHSGSRSMVGLGFSPVAMHYNNALAVLFCALSLWCYATHYRMAARLLAIPVVLIGAVHLLQFLLKGRWGIDFWFHHIIADASFTTTLNLAPSAAVSLSLLGVVQLSLQHGQSAEPRREKLLRDVGLSVLVVTCISLWAVVDQGSAYGWGNLARMAPASIGVFGLLAVAFIALPQSPENTRFQRKTLQIFVRFLVPVVIGAAVILWAKLDRNEAQLIRETIHRQTLMTEGGLQHSLESQAYSLRRMAIRLARQTNPDLESWRADARMYLNDHQGLTAIAFSDGLNDTPAWVLKDEAPDDFRKDDFSKALTEAIRAENKVAISVPSALRDGSSQFVLVSPATESGRGGAAIFAIFDGEALLKGVIPEEFLRQLHVVVTLGDAHLFETTSERDIFYRFWAITDDMDLLGKRWQLTIWPRSHYYAEIRTNLQDIVLVAGLIIAGLLMYSSLLLARAAIAARNLAESEQRLQWLLDNAGEGIFGLDLNGCTTFQNSAAQRITGYSFEEMQGKKQHDIIHHSRADGSHYPIEECKIYRVLKEGGSHFERNEVFWRKDGSCYPVEYTTSAISDEQGELRGAVVVFRDISDLVEIENKLKATNEELESFAYLASHDLKAPLRTISNASQWLAEDLEEHLNDEDRENMALLQSRVKRMDQLLEDLLNYSRIGRVTDDRFRDKINGTAMMDNILALLSPPPHIKVSYSDSFAEVNVARMPLQQMVYNLIGNAIKHHDKEEGAITVNAEIQKNDYRISVTDDGPGIDSKYHKKIFEIFRTLKPRDQVEGSGIGLSVVKKYADIYGGRIEVSSTLGEGSCFTIIWPRKPKETHTA